MANPEVEFGRELEVFSGEVETAIKFFYAWLTVDSVAGDDTRVYNFINQHARFWTTVRAALQDSSLIALGRIFDDDKASHSVERLLHLAETNLGMFSKAAIAERKRKGSADADEWLNEYLRDVCVPTPDDFRRLRRYVDARRKIYKSNYKELRNKVYAHKDRKDQKYVQELFAKTSKRELQQILVFLNRLREALWHLFHNGLKPTLRPARYSVKRMRGLPPRKHGNPPMQELITHETEEFLKSLVSKPAQ